MRKITHIALGAVAAVVLLSGAANSCSSTTGASQSATSDTQQITYSVTGVGRSGLLDYISDGGGSQQQETGVKLPWSKTINVPSGFAFVSLSAQNSGSGSITCTITGPDGTVIKTATSSGPYSIAMCSGTA
jgi:maltose-binding protein MalE